MLIFGFIFACNSDKDGQAIVPMATELTDCDPIDPSLCAFPFPSAFFMVDDETTASGYRIHFGETTLPMNANDVQPSPRFWNERDGFSPLTPIMTHFPDVDITGVIGHDDIDAYLDVDALTVVLDLETGERMPHFVELDMSHDMADRRAFILRPVEPLTWGHRYAVGIRGLNDKSGNAIQVSESFAALRDGQETRDFDVESRRDRYDDVIFPALENTGFSRDELLLAWEFGVASQEGVTGKAVAMRDDLLSRLPEGGPSYTIDEVVDFTADENEHTARRIYGTMTVPYYTEDPKPGFVLSRDENNMPMFMGETERDFTVIVPRSLWENGESGAILQYGHGLMGSQDEVHGGYLAEMADRYGYVLIASDWSGMAHDDIDQIMLMIVNDIQNFAIIPERCQQGFVEFTAAMRMISGDLASDPVLMTTDSEGNPVSVVDTTTRYYYGNSQGGILGTPYAALSTDIDRAVLGVSGGPYSLLLSRSVDFDAYFMLLKTMYEDDFMQISLWIGLMQTLWDSAEPSGYLDAINKSPLPNTNPKEVLIQVAIGDAQVTTLGAHVKARGIGAKLMPDPVRPVWGLEEASSGELGSGLVEWDYGLDEPFVSIPPNKDTDPHGRPRGEFEAQEQLNHFLRTGELVNFCDGPCVDINE
ncbi:MAG: hypothetical protein VXZ96_13220 [Myxococcota bacterium]|nr:hypothetical protein [Myxococcota bacterium]